MSTPVQIAAPKRANRLQATKRNNAMVTAYWEELFRAPDEGKLVCWYEGIQMNPILQAADIAWCHGEAMSALLAARNEEGPAQATAEAHGYDRELCSYARTHIGCGILTQQTEPDDVTAAMSQRVSLGQRVPAPDMIISAYPFCSTGQQWDDMIHRTFGKRVPIFNISMPWIWGNKPSAKYMAGPEFREATDFMVKQLRECITFIEERTGKPYDHDRLSEIMAYIVEASELRLEAMALCKVKPSPASFFEWTNSIAPVNFLPGGPEIVDYFREKKAEIADRVERRVGAVPQERYRLYWDGIMNWNKIGWLADKFAAYDACVVSGRYTHFGFWQEPQVIDVADPLDGMAQNFLTCPISISAPQIIEKTLEHCWDYEIDGMILHGAHTCRAFSYPQFLIGDAVSTNLGMPTAMFEGDMVDESYYLDEIVNSRVEAMLEQIDARRGRGMTDSAAFVMGVDFGSTTGKAVILDDTGAVVGSAVSSEGAVSDEGVRDAMDSALAGAGITLGRVGRAVSTGYGRRMLDVADRTITEITCHARGAVEMAPEARLVIDIGGQDSKVIAVDANGLVEKFVMNDRCAAGTGKFLETLARALSVDLEAMGPMALEATEGVAISAMCATFAETEVIGLLAEGVDRIEILGGVHNAVATRTAGLVSRIGLRRPVVMTGGVARNPAAVAYLERQLGCPLILPGEPQLAGALGAALFALDDFRQEGASRRRADDAVEADLEDAARAMQDCAPACAAKTADTIRRR